MWMFLRQSLQFAPQIWKCNDGSAKAFVDSDPDLVNTNGYLWLYTYAKTVHPLKVNTKEP